MRPVRKITADEEKFRVEPFFSDGSFPECTVTRRDSVEPEPVGTIVLMAFRVTGYDPDCDGSLMARLEHIDRKGEATGWKPNCIGLYPETDLVVSREEWAALFAGKEQE